MVKTQCAICQKITPVKILYKQNFSLRDINENIFSARRLPDGLRYRIVKCRKCGLVFSDPVLPGAVLGKLYRESKFTYGEQVPDLTKTYGFYLKELEKFGVVKDRLLEIGCGSGFLLSEAKKQGYKEVFGVEPSKDAIKKAPRQIRKNIRESIFKWNLFLKDYFNVICFFQTFDHVSDPNKLLSACYKMLKPGGYILALNHNISSFQALILGEKSPIIDIEHAYLYDIRTMRIIFEKNNFEIIFLKPAVNINSLSYLVYLMPLPEVVKKYTLSILKKLRIANLKFRIRIGNLIIIARKPVFGIVLN